MTTKKVSLKRVNEQTVSIAGDRLLFGRLLVAARNRDIDMKELLSYELSAVPYSLAHSDGNMRKTSKSVLLGMLHCQSSMIRPVLRHILLMQWP
jgi:hypothetical protein